MESPDAAVEFPLEMGVGDVALSARADGDEQQLAPATAHVADEFFFSQKLSRLRPCPENTVEPFCRRFVARQRMPKPDDGGSSGRRWKSGGGRSSPLAIKFAIPVFVELNYRLPERQGIGLNIRAAAWLEET